ncbi:hypothetical protein Tco_0159943, partial [Tanacetum coccineum]
AQHYTNEDWDLIRAKLEANAELSKSILGSEVQGEDFAKKMVDLVNQRKKYFAEERARAKRNKPMEVEESRDMEVISAKDVYDELFEESRDMEAISAEDFEATKASLKRFGEELQTKTPKRMKDNEAKEDEPTKKSRKRRKQMARKGLHTSIDKDNSEGLDEDSMKTPSIATYKIIKQGEKGPYQIVKEDGTDVVYINFGAMLKVITRDDLTELYRIVMNRYRMNGPEDELER